MSKNTSWAKIKTPEIKKREAFEVNKKVFKTPQAAAKNVAWNWIFTKYGGMNEFPGMASVKEISGRVCGCAEKDQVSEYDIQYLHEECPIHDRKNGYFAVLHKRIVAYILRKWGVS